MRIFTGLFLASLALLQGCSSTQLSPTGGAVYNALQAETTLRTWVDACDDVSAKAKQAAYTAKQDWWRRNGAYVESADFGLAYDIIHVTDERNETGARMAMALTWQIVETAEAEVQELLNASGNKEELCLRVLSQYSQGERDLYNQDNVYGALAKRLQKDGTDLNLKRAFIEHKTGKIYGRSFYVVEKMAKRNGCADAEVHLLKNAWPHEVYDARCPDSSYLLVRCEWGNCLLTD